MYVKMFMSENCSKSTCLISLIDCSVPTVKSPPPPTDRRWVPSQRTDARVWKFCSKRRPVGGGTLLYVLQAYLFFVKVCTSVYFLQYVRLCRFIFPNPPALPFKGNLHNSTPEGSGRALCPLLILARKCKKTRLKTLAHMQKKKKT